jgi:8-oxo-dGTP pyrophosphatase MutT (NUDIX family)
MGAGVIPFARCGEQVYFLFQTVFSGRKCGYLIDFGGGLGPDEDAKQAAIREFVEETETLYFADDLAFARGTTVRVGRQVPVVEALFEQTLSIHPDWWSPRAQGKRLEPKHWTTFFVEFPYRDIDPLNAQWASDTEGRFKKQRKLIWLSANELLLIYQQRPERLWKRVRELSEAPRIVREIIQDDPLD